MTTRKRFEDGENIGPTWGNVQVTARYISRTHHCFVKCVMEPKLLKDDVYAMEVRAEAWKRGVGKESYRIAHRALQWPTKQHRTMPGAMYSLLMGLDDEMEALSSAKQEQLPF